jgi:hypothetical protein
MPSAGLGQPNPLPPIKPYITASATGMKQEYALPYSPQDDYNRIREPAKHKVAILENDRLRATFLLDLGGRLWSLFHKPTQTELLMTNPVFQPANLAIRNAWFCGGVEWNIAKVGHCVFTCSPIHAARIDGPNGEPILQISEYERSREIPFQVDYYLPDGSDFLFVCPRIVNPHEHSVDMYWWSNIAIRQTEMTRVIAPADEAIGHSYTPDGQREKIDISDEYFSYPTKRTHAADMYFDIPKKQRPWIVAVDSDGKGFVHTSTPRLYGRKMFVWGVETGGQRWQEFLSPSGPAYLEIQAGLSRTQGEYVDMPANATWSWVESYGPIALEPKLAHGDWKQAYGEANRTIQQIIPEQVMTQTQIMFDSVALNSPVESIHQGSGWGSLEVERRKMANQKAFSINEAIFSPGSGDENTLPWLNLIQCGFLPYRSPQDRPGEHVVSEDWLGLLRASTLTPEGNHWLTWYHIGVALVAQNLEDQAMAAWQRSIACEPNAWSCRNLAVLLEQTGEIDKACERILEAINLSPTEKTLYIEASALFVTNRRMQELDRLIERIPESLRLIPRMRLTFAYASLYRGNLEEVESFLSEPLELTDLREGENSITDLWFELQAAILARSEGVPVSSDHQEKARRQTPPPRALDFRMQN